MLLELLLIIKFLLTFNLNFFKNSFSPAVITKWNNLDISIRKSSSCHVFKNLIQRFIRSEPNRISSTQNFEGLRLLIRMRLGLSQLGEHKFRHDFQNCLKPICSCVQEIEKSISFFAVSIVDCSRQTFFEKLTHRF